MNGNTTRKIKIIGTQEYINSETGELVSMQVTSVQERDFNFSKVWMKSFLTTLELVGNAKSKVAYWIIDNINRENMLTFTYRQIAEGTGMSLDTVRKTMKTLLEANFLRRKNQGCYIVNPDIVFRGTRSMRLNMLTQFSSTEREPLSEITPEQRLENILNAIQKLSMEAESLSNKINSEALKEEKRR